ncbi:MAG: hypothetical protein QW678_00360 [Candidatus Aenigmatarchaeota archaeon]
MKEIMSKLKKFKNQFSLEYFVGFFALFSLLYIFFYVYLDSNKKFVELINFFNEESECYFLASKFNSLFPIIVRNITYIEEFYIDLKNFAKIENYRIFIGNVSCFTKIEKIEGIIKNGKNIIIVENGNVKVI